MEKVLEITELKKYYGKARGVESVSFDLHQGEILGFVGPNGAGKSTVIRTIMGLIQKTAGSIKIFGKNPNPETNALIGYLPSEIFLYPELSVYKQLVYFSKIRKVNTDRILELSERLNLDLNRKIRELSFGNRKKVGIITALLHSPKIIILDEPTSGLDPLIQQEFFAILEEEKKHGASILLSSHVLSEIEKICNRVLLIKEGEILFSDSIENLKKNEYKKVFVSPVLEGVKLEGLEYLGKHNSQTIYSFKGDINHLVQQLSYYRLQSLRIEDLDLEEIFIHYYRKEKEND
ncbi:MAG TPA: ABC transporter ATP-binding protein [Acholeplasmataceae bacterium]|jgi:ABC-2 type transport system ATP-binding protein|nr:ABC transporter ATP-binding protein [Acholeplasmataceae bacterium]